MDLKLSVHLGPEVGDSCYKVLLEISSYQCTTGVNTVYNPVQYDLDNGVECTIGSLAGDTKLSD